MTKKTNNDDILTQYLLGSLSEEKTERLDELGIADDETAARLQVLENDLVDAYVRGGLSGETLRQFESFYLTSPGRRERVSFARTLLVYGEKTSVDLATAERRSPAPAVRGSATASERVSPLRSLFVPRAILQWGFAAAAFLLLFAAGYLTVQNVRLRHQITQTQSERRELEQRELDLQQLLTERRSADAETEKDLARVRERLAQLEQGAIEEGHGKPEQRDLKIVAFNLAPQTRGVGQIQTLAAPAGTDYLALTLELETDAFSTFRAALKNPATGQTVWRSGDLKAGDKNRTVRVRVPANLLNTPNYVIELSGISSGGAAELVSSYPFRVVTK